MQLFSISAHLHVIDPFHDVICALVSSSPPPPISQAIDTTYNDKTTARERRQRNRINSPDHSGMKLTTDYEREREAERKFREKGRPHSRRQHKLEPNGADAEATLALGTREKCPCAEIAKQLLEQH